MQTNKLATAFIVGALTALLLTFGSFQSVYAGGGHGHGNPPVNPPQKIGNVQQLRLNQSQYPGSTELVAPQKIMKGQKNPDLPQ